MVQSGIVFLVVVWGIAAAVLIPNILLTRVLAGLLFLVGLFILFFFRDPSRKIEVREGYFLSPADGKILSCSKSEAEGIGQCTIVKIFLSIFDVHLQRAPVKGRIVSIKQEEGAFKVAYKPEASKVNRKNTILIESGGKTIGVAQIAGLIARRIECWVGENDTVEQGQKIGFIRFGSQVDMFLPENVELDVKPGDKVKAGLTIIGIGKNRDSHLFSNNF